jgi:Bifunctional DNA primase/polymerase, N-terminal/Primase C terminal 1 (PriCT-1)
MTSLLQTAIAFADQGLRVLPLHSPLPGPRCTCSDTTCEVIGKHPRIARGCHGAVRDPDQIRRWWNRWPDANLGLATGSGSGIYAIDIDPRHGGDDTLRALEDEHGPLPPTWRFLTGGGGEHIVFRYPAGVKFGNTASSALGEGIDTRGEGGLIVAPPSLHASGRPYAFSVDHHPAEVPLADMPGWLLTRLQAPKRAGAPGGLPHALRGLAEHDAPEGRRNQTLAALSGHLLRHYVDPYAVIEIARCWNEARCRPPMADDEVISVVNSICRRELKRREAAR